MNNYIKRTFLKFLVILISLIIILSISISLLVKEDYFKDISNSCRVLVSNQLNDISNNHNNEIYKYTLVSLDGTIIKSTEDNAPKSISLHNLSFDNWHDINSNGIVRYSTPLIINGKIDKIVIFSIPKKDILNLRNDNNYKDIFKLTTIFILLLIIFIIYKIYKLIAKDVLKPIDKMHKSASEILKGNYLEIIDYDYHGEIGEFSHDFECMRDNLMVASEKEKQLKIAEKELLACISHDLKTPIANISGYCNGIIDGVVREEKDIKRYAGIILKKARVLTKLLDDILELSKAEINQMTINKQEVYTKEFFQELLEELSLDIVSSGRDLKLHGEIPNLLINLDKEKITQVIVNIVSNAVKYTYENGIITMSFNKISQGIEIIIKDNGIGIGADEIPLIFNKFYRGDKHRNQNIPGSGLGLSIAKYITEMHNGNIKILSGKGNGTTVVVTFRN